ncbi:hypothetical protein PSSM2_214 [uncultured phage MedDCM-OCT-S08-C1281]|nr:hypothetical protein PSSM2_214 [uncultured phage MedDCM-OCT-S08-C1115]ADD95429.1 hypothetical protein PSSM2_214 [uncultured phage MedDCM-OCT-S08-C1281]BAR27607.1 putative long tail fiber protein [uncultured Mediterranean phage uvMED]BAR27650.1 putative long tail fiber protein [uncultured Mediterranean phage uvMED]BAR27754.1 putative long tail fiber protein [uncultured Mediterranean phage uvMED]|tara:strand:- start:24350 stop:24685 length:336 start_codon:yes stop_codon:yes gene_type:complete
MAAIPVNIVVDRHANFDVTFFITNKDGTPLNMVGYTGEAHFKKSYSATASVQVPLVFVNRTSGEIGISMTGAETGVLDRRRYVYDILLESPQGYKTRVIEGIVEVNPGVSS